MGIRVHKAVGFGLNDFKAPEGFNDRYGDLGEMTVGEFVNWCIERQERIMRLSGNTDDGHYSTGSSFHWELERFKDSDEALWHPVVWDPEFGLKNVILFIPLPLCLGGDEKWFRYNDTLDWIEETARRHQTNWCLEVERKHLYPYYVNESPNFVLAPMSVAALMLFLGIQDRIKDLKGLLYVYWG